MAKSYEINVNVTGAEKLAQVAENISRSYQRADAAQKGVEQSTARTAQVAQRFASGPAQKILQLGQQETAARGMGDDPRATAFLRDLPILRFRAERSQILGDRRVGQGAAALKAPGLLDLFQDLNRAIGAIGSGNPGALLGPGIRLLGGLNTGGGMNVAQTLAASNIVGGAAGTAGNAAAGAAQGAAAATSGAATAVAGTEAAGALAAVAAAALPVTIAFTVAAAALAAMVAVVKSTAEMLRNLNAAAAEGGPGTGSRIAGLGAFGISPEQAAGLAASLRGKLGSDPYAIAMGGFVPGMPFGPTDNIKILQREIRELRALQGNPDAQFRRASVLGLQSLLPSINVSPGVQRQQDRGFAIQGQVFDEKSLAVGRDFNAELAITSGLFTAMTVELGKPFLTEFVTDLRILNDALSEMVPVATLLGNVFAVIGRFSELGRLFEFLDILGKIARLFGGGNDSALKAHTDAMRDHTAAMKADAALYKGLPRGPRSDHALSAAQAAELYRRAAENAAIGAGAHRL